MMPLDDLFAHVPISHAAFFKSLDWTIDHPAIVIMPANTHIILKVVFMWLQKMLSGEKVCLSFVKLSIVIDIIGGRKVMMNLQPGIVKLRHS